MYFERRGVDVPSPEKNPVIWNCVQSERGMRMGMGMGIGGECSRNKENLKVILFYLHTACGFGETKGVLI